MKNNIILSVSTVILQIFRVVISIGAAVQILIFIGASINNLAWEDVISVSESLVQTQSSYSLYELAVSNFWLAFFITLQNIVLIIILFQILGYGVDIIKNIHSLKTFTKDNIKAFSRISVLAIALVLVNFLKLSPERIGFTIEFSYVFFALAAIILTQVFKEGQRLLEENELTV
jgi:hypothetical protein